MTTAASSCCRAAGSGTGLRLLDRLRRLIRAYERLPGTLAALHLVAFILRLRKVSDFAADRKSL